MQSLRPLGAPRLSPPARVTPPTQAAVSPERLAPVAGQLPKRVERPACQSVAARLKLPQAPKATKAQRLKQAAQEASDWRLGLRDVEQEHVSPLSLTPSQGSIPKDLQGTLVRIGPARFDIYGERVDSWWDGEGMVHALHLENGEATYRNRFVETAERKEEARLKRREYATLAGRPRHGLLGLIKNQMRSKNLANTSIAQVGNKLLALYESDIPHALDPHTLETLGLETFDGVIKKSFGAHPKTHPSTGSVWNFGFEVGMPANIRVYECTQDGQMHDRFSFQPPYLTPFIHDFVLTEHKAAFVFSPMVIERFPLRMMLGLCSPLEACRWEPQQGSVAMVFDLRTGEQTRWKLPAQLVIHTVDGQEHADGRLSLDLFAQDNADGIQVAVDMARLNTPEHHWPSLRRLTLNPDGTHAQADLGAQMDFPDLSPVPTQAAQRQKVYGLGWRPDKELYGEPMVFDRSTGKTLTAPLGPNEFASEMVAVARADARDEHDVYLLSFVLNGPQQRTELRIYDGADLSEKCRIPLPHAVPHTVHGIWVEDAPLA